MVDNHKVEGLKRYLKKKGGSNYYYDETITSLEDKKWLEGILYSNGTLNTFVFNLLFS